MHASRLASAGVRSLPIGYDAKPKDVKRIMEGVNGLFLPGGIPPPTDGVRQVQVQVQQRAPIRCFVFFACFPSWYVPGCWLQQQNAADGVRQVQEQVQPAPNYAMRFVHFWLPVFPRDSFQGGLRLQRSGMRCEGRGQQESGVMYNV